MDEISESAHILLGGMVGSDTTLSVDLGYASPLPNTLGVINTIGIIFYQEINAAFYELASENAMKVAAIG